MICSSSEEGVLPAHTAHPPPLALGQTFVVVAAELTEPGLVRVTQRGCLVAL